MSDTGQIVVITGASAGIGRALVQASARRGARIALLARGQAGLDAAREEALDLGARDALVIPTDVADAGQVEAAARQVDEAWGPVDVWINNAMTSVFAPFTEITPEEYQRVTDVVYHGMVWGTRSALARMLPRDRGRIVLVGSALAYRGIPLQSPYCGAKHATQGFFDSVRAELLHDKSKVRISMVHLSAMNTPQFSWVRTRLPNHPQPVPPMYQPEVAAQAILWAADRGVRELNVGAPTVLTRWANKFVPGLLDHYLGRTGYASQQTDEPIDPATWRDNLDQPLDDHEDMGAHGEFDEQAKSFSPQVWAAMHKPQLTLAGVAAGIAGRVLGTREHD